MTTGSFGASASSDVTLRDARESDLPGIVRIYNDVIATTTAVYSTEPVTLENRRAWFESRRSQGFPVLVAVREGGEVVAVREEGEVVGFASLGEFRGGWSGYRYTVEHSVHVDASMRGEGIGGRLIEALLPRAKGLGMHVVLGAIDASNEGSLRFHRRLGFFEVARMPQVGRKFGRWLDLVFMQIFVDEEGAPREEGGV